MPPPPAPMLSDGSHPKHGAVGQPSPGQPPLPAAMGQVDPMIGVTPPAPPPRRQAQNAGGGSAPGANARGAPSDHHLMPGAPKASEHAKFQPPIGQRAGFSGKAPSRPAASLLPDQEFIPLNT